MRVVILYNTSWYVYLLRRNLITNLQDAGCEVIVVAPRDNYTSRLLKFGVRHVSIPLDPASTNPLTELRTFSAILRTLRILRPDAVLSFTIKCNLYAGLCKRFTRFTQVANISGLGIAFDQDGLMRRIAKSLYRLALHPTDHIFFQNTDDLHHCTNENLVPKNRSHLIPGSGVDLDAFTPTFRKQSSPRTFLIFGRLLPQKGYDLFLKAAKQLRDECGDAAEFLILGAPDTTRQESLHLFDRIKSAHAEGTVRYLQNSDDVRPILNDVDVVVLPSTYNEGIPRSLLEAMACGKVIITTNWKGCRETVEHSVNGYLVPPHDQDALTAAMRKMIVCSEKELDSMGHASRLRAERLFDERFVLDAYLNALSLPLQSTTTPYDIRHTGTDA